MLESWWLKDWLIHIDKLKDVLFGEGPVVTSSTSSCSRDVVAYSRVSNKSQFGARERTWPQARSSNLIGIPRHLPSWSRLRTRLLSYIIFDQIQAWLFSWPVLLLPAWLFKIKKYSDLRIPWSWRNVMKNNEHRWTSMENCKNSMTPRWKTMKHL